jgi:hypothetical protein
MKLRRQLQQAFREQVKEKPGEKKPKSTLSRPQEPGERWLFEKRHSRQLLQTVRANNPVVMLGDAFATEELSALGTTRHSLTCSVIQTALMDQ